MFIPTEVTAPRREYIENLKLRNGGRGKKALIITYGCQQNETDSDKLYGMLFEMGYEKAVGVDSADVVIFNTCSVRENAEAKVYGAVGALKPKKLKKPGLIVGVCGCLMQQPHAAEKVRKSYGFVDMVFGTHVIHKFPEILYNAIANNEKTYMTEQIDGCIVEGTPVFHEKNYKISIPVMYGCNNFCTYCVVPRTRGRERSRKASDVLNEISKLCKNGLKEITLLGQNVNSYNGGMDFPDLLSEIVKFDPIKRVRFVTSHPKDLTGKLIAVMAENEKICKSLHLPFQAGNNRILKEMNRKYTRESYLALVSEIKAAMPGIALTSDVIVGFPNETDPEFSDTLSLVEQARFDSLYTFIYSKRKDTAAEKMPDNRTYGEKLANFNKLLKLQTKIGKEINDTYLGNIYEIMDEGISKNNPDTRAGRTDTNKIINYTPKSNLNEGDFVKVKVTEVKSWSLNGEEV